MDGYKDTAELANECNKRIAHLKELAQAEQEHREELERQEQERIWQEQERKQKEQYLRLGEELKTATTEEDWQNLAKQFRKMSGYRNTAELAEKCDERCRKRRYNRLCQEAEQMFRKEDATEGDWRKLAKQFREMNGYKNTAELLEKCEEKIRVLKEQREEAARQWEETIEFLRVPENIKGADKIGAVCGIFGGVMIGIFAFVYEIVDNLDYVAYIFIAGIVFGLWGGIVVARFIKNRFNNNRGK
jgi:hypothetical protein